MAGELFDLAVEMIGGGLAEKMGQELADRLAGAAARGCGDPTRTCGSWRPSWVTTRAWWARRRRHGHWPSEGEPRLHRERNERRISYTLPMRAIDVLEEYPLIRSTDSASAAAQLLAARRLPGVVVVDETGQPIAVLPASEVVRFVIPTYVQDDPSLARVYDEKAADACAGTPAGRCATSSPRSRSGPNWRWFTVRPP